MEYTETELNKISVYSLRNLARVVGVKAPTTLRKDELIKEIIEIKSEIKKPYISTKQGRPVKNTVNYSNFDSKNLDVNELKKEIKKEFIDIILNEIEKKLNEIL